MQCYVIDSNKLNNIYWKTRQKMRSNSMSNRQGEKHYPKMRRAVGEKKKQDETVMKSTTKRRKWLSHAPQCCYVL